ncbi:MAG TPA: VWA domain-containing protein [Syntrophales bacterium]|nr:VWA domain-containing protein [Syntrophales bacterium]
MNFAHPWMLHFIWLLPLVMVGMVLSARRRERVLASLADPDLLAFLVARERPGVRFFRAALTLLALFLLIIALAGPQWGSHYQEVQQKGVDIMLTVDVSPSMLVTDVQPSRLELAKRKVQDFLRVVSGDRVGLVAFSGAAFVQCPLTLDYEALVMFLTQLEPGLIPVPGTDLGAAINKTLAAFDNKSETDKVILLITDGEDNEGKGRNAAAKARDLGVKIYIFGIGDTAGGPIPEPEGKGGFAKDKSGKVVLSKLDEEGLATIASTTGGSYIRASTSGDPDLDIIYFAGIKAHTKARELKSGKIKVYEERFPFFVALALILLLFEGLFGTRVKG